LEASYQNQKDEKKSERSCYIHTMLLEAKLGKKKKKLWRLKQYASEVGVIIVLDFIIISIGDSRMNPFKERENDTIYVSVGQTDLVFSLIFPNV